MTTLADFFPDGEIHFVPPPFDERYWAQFGIPAKVRVNLWGGELTRGLVNSARGTQHSGPGGRRSFGGGRKARGMASDGYDHQKAKASA